MLETSRLRAIRELPLAKSEYGIEDFERLTPAERIGLSEPKVYITSGDKQKLEVTMAVAILANSGKNRESIIQTFLKQFNLNAELYGKENPRGIFLKFPPDTAKENVVKDVIYCILGVNQENRVYFFADVKNYMNLLSGACKETVSQVERQRKEFPLEHPEEFPGLGETLDEIIKYSRVEAIDIFKKGKIPPMFSGIGRTTNKEQLLLAEALSMIVPALNGRQNVAQIARERRKPVDVARSLLTNRNTSPLAPPMFALVNERLKKSN